MLYFGSCAGTFYALDKNNGKIRWSSDVGGKGKVEFHGNPLVTEELVIIATDIKDQPSGNGYVYAFEKSNGKLRWKSPAGRGIASDFISVGSSIYGVSLNDELFCMNLIDGQVIWVFSTRPDRHDLLPSTPAAAGKNILFGDRDGGLYALDAQTGKIVWTQKIATPISTSLVVAGNHLYFGAANHVYRVDWKTGAVNSDFLADGWSFGRPVIADDSILIFLGNELTSIELSLKKVRWRQQTDGRWRTPRPYLWGETVVAGNELGGVFAFRVSNGTLQWSSKFEGMIRSIGGSDQILYIGTREGKVYAYTPDRRNKPSS